MMRSADVVVLGLGPAGVAAAAEAARRGCKVIALDRKRAPGLPVQCAELVPQLVEVRPDVIRQRIDSMATFVEDVRLTSSTIFQGTCSTAPPSMLRSWKRHGAPAPMSSFLPSSTGCFGGRAGRRHPLRRRSSSAPTARARAPEGDRAVNTELVETRQITVTLREPYAATDVFLSAEIPGGYGWLFPKGERTNLGAGVSPAHKAG